MMNIDQLITMNGAGERERLLPDSQALLQNLNKEIRTISHLLHPPLLDEVGLSSALQWYVDGFAKRSGIATTLELGADFGRVNSDLEIAIFRVVQECLTNVHRHSGSSKAIVRLNRSQDAVLLEIQDEGKGIAPDKRSQILGSGPLGVGLRGMRERVLQLEGTLDVQSDDRGTNVQVMFPIAKSSPVSSRDVKVNRLETKIVFSSSRAGSPVFQIAYDRTLLKIREELLKNRGYDVVSVLGNEDAQRSLARDQDWRLFILGHNAPPTTREAMVRWLKGNFPQTKVLALNPPSQVNLTHADFNFELDGSEEWLTAVASTSG